MKTPKQVLQDWVAAYNARDPYALIELYHEDAVNHQVAFGDPLKGREALLESFVAFFGAFPDNYTHVENLFADDEWGMVEWSGGGTFLGELDGCPPTGKRYTLQGCGFFHILDGKIHFQRGYIDKYTWFTQIGLPVS
ncbi:ester cyclase [Phormidium sp. FACHB-592]|uniref:Ester cyclase n=1 Tax=Stenomitos frigidus AS-A4 TaxID=2933935 RepID=A0ABV0KM75_9CYAN|nr:ester cyclase [Phormidium sp. FACHB-592]MBD2072597.1 ester cyclase [Phormidium sp. FACHB-592]